MICHPVADQLYHVVMAAKADGVDYATTLIAAAELLGFMIEAGDEASDHLGEYIPAIESLEKDAEKLKGAKWGLPLKLEA